MMKGGIEHMSSDRIEKEVVLRAPLERVWRAISDADEFGQWFGVRFDGPFVCRQAVRYRGDHPDNGRRHGREGPGALCRSRRTPGRSSRSSRSGGWAFRWHPYGVEDGVDYSKEPTTLVEFTLDETADGVRSAHRGIRIRGHPRRAQGVGVRGQQRRLGRTDRAGAEVPHAQREGVSASAVAAKAPLFDALGDPNRLRIITRLCDGGPSSTTDVTQAVAVSRQAATKHLMLLEAVGLVSSERKGRERIWRVQTEAPHRRQ